MAFNLLSKTLALIYIFNLHRGVVAEEDPRILAVYDATPEQLAAIAGADVVEIPEIKVKNWDETLQTVMKGDGVAIQRDEENQKKWLDFKKGKSVTEIENHFAKKLNWQEPISSAVPNLFSENLAEKEEWVKFTPAEFPINVPSGEVSHEILWLRVPMTTKEMFSARQGEKLPEEILKYDAMDLVEFIHAHDSFGTNVEPEKYESILQAGENLRMAPRDKIYGYEGKVTREDGIKAILFVGKYITSLIKAHYPGKVFAWFRVNRWLRNFHSPNEIHILLKNEQVN